VGSEGSWRGDLEHSESEPRLADSVGNLAKRGKAQKLDNTASQDGCVQVQAGRINRGSPVSFRKGQIQTNGNTRMGISGAGWQMIP